MLRRALAIAVTGLCAVAGPAASSALADAGVAPTITLGASQVRPGLVFTASTTVGCPSEDGSQTVDFTFTDSTGMAQDLGSVDTDEDGSWTTAQLKAPVSGIDDGGDWVSAPVAPGLGSLEADCLSADGSGDDAAVRAAGATDDPGKGSGSVHAPSPTQTYAAIPLTVAGTAAQLVLSPAMIVPGGSITVTPAQACPGAGTVALAVTPLVVPDDSGDPGDDQGSDDPGSGDPSGSTGDDGGSDAVVSATAATSGSGTWAPVTLALPADAAPGDYGVSADCLAGGTTTSSYDGEPLAVGTVKIGTPDCTATVVTAPLTGSYTGDVAGVSPAKPAQGDAGLSLPIKIKLAGRGPWTVAVRSAATGQPLASRKLACPAPHYELDVINSGLTGANRLRVRVCNTGNATVDAVLQVLHGKRYRSADDESLDPNECSWLVGDPVSRNTTVTARVLIDPPGKGRDVVDTVHVRRGRH